MIRSLAVAAFCLAVALGAGPTPAAADDADLGSPQATMLGYLQACRDGDFARAARHLNLAPVPAAQRAARGPELAAQLKSVLDQTLWVDIESLSTEPGGDADDGLPANRDRVGAIQTEDDPVDVFVDRVPDASGEAVWKVSSATVARIPELADRLGAAPLITQLPAPLRELRLFEIVAWQWLGLLVALVAAWVAGWLVASGLVAVLRPLVARSRSDFDDRLVDLVLSPLRLLLTVGLFALGTVPLHLSVPAARFFRGLELTLVVVGITWMIFRLVDLAAAILEHGLDEDRRAAAGHFVPIGARALKSALGAMAVLAALDSFGLDVTAVIAGLGVGGIAVALAAQKTLENVFGGVTILADQPVRPGQFCRFGDQIGTVEEIGLRSTRVRTLDRTVITVPNADFSTLQIENYASRDRIRLAVTLGLRYETTPEQLRHVLAGLRALLYSHPRVLPDARVRLVSFGAYSLDLEVFSYVDTADWAEFLAIREDVYLRMMDVVAASGSGFAFPSQTAYVARDEGLDEARARAAESEVAGWREAGELPFPDHARERIDALGATLPWPPEGSARASGR